MTEQGHFSIRYRRALSYLCDAQTVPAEATGACASPVEPLACPTGMPLALPCFWMLSTGTPTPSAAHPDIPPAEPPCWQPRGIGENIRLKIACKNAPSSYLFGRSFTLASRARYFGYLAEISGKTGVTAINAGASTGQAGIQTAQDRRLACPKGMRQPTCGEDELADSALHHPAPASTRPSPP
ncbi:MAG: hypothetical protein KME26_23370 [Oscillatoria princeps RMCB-10]|nr:hypothetical protein [Oscillatoria princeps RMCB-10]